MKGLLIASLVLLQISLHGMCEGSEKVILFTNILTPSSTSLNFRNDTATKVEDIKYHVDCGCVVIQDCPSRLERGEIGKINISFKPPAQGQRKINTIILTGSPAFSKRIDLVNYFFSDIPQVFGDTNIHIAELPGKNSAEAVIVIADKTLGDTQFLFDSSPYIHCVLSPPLPIENGNGCFKRILEIELSDAGKLLNEGRKMISTRVNSNRQIVVTVD
jgi:hypothetical protein